ncbi:MAG: hypothetical protein NXI01_02665 [Gammaproteobacteria bacterium]|nr:hypothetical protein [Gammaproteobacteria bacterium]
MWKYNWASFFDKDDLAAAREGLTPKIILGESSHQILTMILGPILLHKFGYPTTIELSSSLIIATATTGALGVFLPVLYTLALPKNLPYNEPLLMMCFLSLTLLCKTSLTAHMIDASMSEVFVSFMVGTGPAKLTMMGIMELIHRLPEIGSPQSTKCAIN